MSRRTGVVAAWPRGVRWGRRRRRSEVDESVRRSRVLGTVHLMRHAFGDWIGSLRTLTKAETQRVKFSRGLGSVREQDYF